MNMAQWVCSSMIVTLTPPASVETVWPLVLLATEAPGVIGVPAVMDTMAYVLAPAASPLAAAELCTGVPTPDPLERACRIRPSSRPLTVPATLTRMRASPVVWGVYAVASKLKLCAGPRPPPLVCSCVPRTPEPAPVTFWTLAASPSMSERRKLVDGDDCDLRMDSSLLSRREHLLQAVGLVRLQLDVAAVVLVERHRAVLVDLHCRAALVPAAKGLLRLDGLGRLVVGALDGGLVRLDDLRVHALAHPLLCPVRVMTTVATAAAVTPRATIGSALGVDGIGVGVGGRTGAVDCPIEAEPLLMAWL